MIGTFAVFLTDKPLTYGSFSNFYANPSKKCVYLLIKWGTTQMRSISLLFDLRSST